MILRELTPEEKIGIKQDEAINRGRLLSGFVGNDCF